MELHTFISYFVNERSVFFAAEGSTGRGGAFLCRIPIVSWKFAVIGQKLFENSPRR
jgi:hypothetical protein